MAESKTALTGEITEADATGELARVYAELRSYCGVPYVSSLQRFVATMPGALEYAWATMSPAFRDGSLPQTAWRLAGEVEAEPLPPISAPALRLMGVDAGGAAAIRNICDNFVRVAPINLLFAACVEMLLAGARPDGGGGARGAWTPPEMLPPMGPMVDLNADPAVGAVLRQLATEIDGKPFVPGLYRLIARWPGYLAHAATLLEPLIRSETARRRRGAIATRIVGAADGVLANLPVPDPAHRPPSPEQASAIVAAIRTYRVTSPEMVVFGTLLRDALPSAA
jgi:hypothetical protein